MKVKFIGATPEEDKIVDIPDGVTTVEISNPTKEEAELNMWPYTTVFIAALLALVAIVWIIFG